MTSVNTSKPNNNDKKRKNRFLPNYKPVKKGLYPLRAGVQGFFITCDGGRERQASHEAINVIDSFHEELVHGTALSVKSGPLHNEKINKKIKFTYSDSGSDNDEDGDEFGKDQNKEEEKDKTENKKSSINGNSDSHEVVETTGDDKVESSLQITQDVEVEEPLAKENGTKENVVLEGGNITKKKVEEKSIDKLIEEELQELGDKSKRRFSNLDSGCNGLVFVQMRKIDGDPSPTDIVQHMMNSLAKTKKHMSRFLLRVLPIEVSCYASEDEITKALKPLISLHFPTENHGGHKFAVLYEARANTGIDRTKIINAVAKCVPAPHTVDLNNPDKSIVVQIVKTVCLIGVVEKYKELGKYNVRQLTAPTP